MVYLYFKYNQKQLLFEKLQERLAFSLSEIETKQKEQKELLLENSELKSTIAALKERLTLQTENFIEQKESLKKEIDIAMQKILQEKLKSFDENSKYALRELLEPFKNSIETFIKKIDENQKESIEKLARLSKEIELISQSGIAISKEANNLAKALKGEKQAQGRWGEMVLESILENSGLIKDVHYFVQNSFKDDNGATKRPDVIIKLPHDKTIIIDSKVSLVDYDAFIAKETQEEKDYCAKNLVTTIKNHINNLSSKNYNEYKIDTFEYIFMFIPIEGAYSIALHYDPSLYDYALKKKVVVVYPATLIVMLKTIWLYWQYQKADENAKKIIQEAAKIYDRFFAFHEEFIKFGSQIDKLQKSYLYLNSQISNSKNGLIERVKNLKEFDG